MDRHPIKGYEMKRIINKYTLPNRLHFADKGTVARVQLNNIISYWVQTSENETNPEWRSIGDLLEKKFEKLFIHEAFIQELMDAQAPLVGEHCLKKKYSSNEES